jgi:hypothetical protein
VVKNRSKYLGNVYNTLLASFPTQFNRANVLCESFTLSLQQIMSGLSSLELRLHQSQGLPSREDCFSILRGVSTSLINISFDCLTPAPDILAVLVVQEDIGSCQ